MKPRIRSCVSYALCMGAFVFGLHVYASTSSELRVVTFNFNAETANNILKVKRLAIVEDYIAKNNLDVVFVQESWSYGALPNFAIQVAKDLNMDLFYHLEDGVSGVRVTGLTILAKKDLGLNHVKAFKLPHSAPTFGNGQTSWISLGETNMLIGAQIKLRNGQAAFLWTAHLSNGSSSKRLDQIKFAIEQMHFSAQESHENWNSTWVIFGGDFNSTPDTQEMTYLRSIAGFEDSWLKSHPQDPGHTLVGDYKDPEYNPMDHGAQLFPPQYAFDTPGRIDYLYVHGPTSFGAAVTRVFTAPISGVWMSDHYGLAGHFDFAGDNGQSSASADSDMASLGSTASLEIDDSLLTHPPAGDLDFEVKSPRGFTLVNTMKVKAQIVVSDPHDNVYPANKAIIGQNNMVSFAFFAPGAYPYNLIIHDFRPTLGHLEKPVVYKINGILHVP